MYIPFSASVEILKAIFLFKFGATIGWPFEPNNSPLTTDGATAEIVDANETASPLVKTANSWEPLSPILILGAASLPKVNKPLTFVWSKDDILG